MIAYLLAVLLFAGALVLLVGMAWAAVCLINAIGAVLAAVASFLYSPKGRP